MEIPDIAFNIDLLLLKDQDVKNIRPIKVLDIFQSATRNFHPDGLFSLDTFGKIGEEKRNRLFSYIDIRVSILHPILFKALVDTKSLYGEILSGTSYAIFNIETNDFDKSDPINGETGYSFFMDHFPDIKFEERPSYKREFNIKLINIYRDNATFNKLIVMPAGLRDYVIDSDGKPSEDEINGLYRKVFSIASVAENVNIKTNYEYLDSARYSIQLAVNDIYNYIKNMLEGKSKFILAKWASRKVFNSTRNVATSYLHDAAELNSHTNVSTNQTVVGLYQYLRAILPLAVKHTRDTYLSDIFIGSNSPAMLVNKKTLKKEAVNLDPDYYDEWMTYEGLEKVMAKFGQENIRHDYLETKDHYFGLIYKGKDGTFKIFQDKDDLPEDRSMDDVSPLTFVELLYLSVFKDSSSIPCLVTRYPITGYGSIYPSYVYLKSTTKSEVRIELDDNWQPTNVVANEFPIFGQQFFNSVSPALKNIGRLGLDYDGDTVSFTCLLTEDAKEEIHRTLNSKEFYVSVNGRMAFNGSTDIIDLVLANITA